jgi:methyltransferase (TIGR00027 family)
MLQGTDAEKTRGLNKVIRPPKLDNLHLLEGGISGVSETLLITLYARALETKTKDPVLKDTKAAEIAEKLRPDLLGSSSVLRRNLAKGKIRKNLRLYIALRGRRYDQYAEEFLKDNPKGIVVNLGCGLDTRFFRIDDGKLVFYDLDLPQVIEIKKKLLSESDRYHYVASSVLNYAWMDRLKERHGGPFLFLAEGLFMYLPQEDVKKLVIEMHRSFPGSELACEMANSIIQKTPMRQIMGFKMRKQLHLGKDAFYSSGISDGKDIERWAHGIRLLDEWSYFDVNEKKLGLYRMMRHIPLFRKMQWTVHYLL